MADYPYILYSANVAPNKKPSGESKSDEEEENQRARVERETLKAEREKKKADLRKQQQQVAMMARKGVARVKQKIARRSEEGPRHIGREKSVHEMNKREMSVHHEMMEVGAKGECRIGRRKIEEKDSVKKKMLGGEKGKESVMVDILSILEGTMRGIAL